MIQSSVEKRIGAFADKIYPHLIKMEIVVVVLSITGFYLNLKLIEAGGILLTLGLLSLAIVYFFLAYRTSNENLNKLDKFIVRLLHYSYSFAILGILYVLEQWPAGTIMMQMSILALSMAIIAIIFLKLLNKPTFIRSVDIYRTLIIATIVVGLYYMPLSKNQKQNQNQDNTEQTIEY